MTNQNTTARERLANKLRPALIALGKAASTESGKAMFALAYDADFSLDFDEERERNTRKARATRAHEEARYYAGLSRGRRNAYVEALAIMTSEASEGAASVRLCRHVINAEIDAMRSRTPGQQTAAPITNLHTSGIEF